MGKWLHSGMWGPKRAVSVLVSFFFQNRTEGEAEKEETLRPLWHL